MKTILRWVAVLPVSIFTFIAIFFVLKYIFGLLTFFAPYSEYGGAIELFAIGLGSHSFIMAGGLMAPSHKTQAALLLMLFAICFVIFRLTEMITDTSTGSLEYINCFLIIVGVSAAYFKIKKDGVVTFDSFLVG